MKRRPRERKKRVEQDTSAGEKWIEKTKNKGWNNKTKAKKIRE